MGGEGVGMGIEWAVGDIEFQRRDNRGDSDSWREQSGEYCGGRATWGGIKDGWDGVGVGI